MSALLLRVAFAAVRLWTHVYTCGLPPDAREIRRDEIESDLWEWQHDSARSGGTGDALHVLARLALGGPDDVMWRVTQASSRRRRTVGAAATLLLVLSVWVYLQMGPQTLPVPPARPMQFVEDPPRTPPPPPPPPVRPPGIP